MAYLSQLSPDILKLLTSDQNAKYTDPSGMVYYGNWSAPTQGNDENAALPAQFLGQLIGIPGLNAPDGSQMASYDANGNFAGYGTTGVQTDFMDRFAPIMAAGILGGGALAASGLGGAAAGASGAEGAGAAGAGFLGDATAAGYGGLDAASAATMGGGASIGGGAALGSLGGAGAVGGYLGDATAAGYGGLDAASASSLGGGASINGGAALGTGAAGAGGAAGSTGGGAGGAAGGGSLIPGVSNSSLLGLGSTALGALGGAQGTQSGGTSTRTMDPRLDPAVYGAGGIVPSAQGLLTSQLPQAQAAGQQMMSVGSGLLGQPIAGNGVGQVHLNAPTTATNPYLGGMADDIARRTQTLLGQNNQAIQGAFVGSGGLGGSRQGIAQGTAAGQAADSLQGQLANLYGTQYSQDQNRALQQYGLDQNFYGQQRGQDLTGAGVGSSLIGQGLNAGWQPIQNASSAISPFTGYGTTTNSTSSGGGAMGAIGGALGAAQLAKNFGWWG